MPVFGKTPVTLGDRLQDGGSFSPGEGVSITLAILRALEAYHKRGRAHLELDPDCVLLEEEGVRLCWKVGGYPRKLWYQAPEVQMRQYQSLGYRADLYSVTAILFHLLLGRPLREREILGSGLRELPGLLPGMGRRASGLASQILRRGMHTLPQRRYQSAGELRRDLEALAEELRKEP